MEVGRLYSAIEKNRGLIKIVKGYGSVDEIIVQIQIFEPVRIPMII